MISGKKLSSLEDPLELLEEVHARRQSIQHRCAVLQTLERQHARLLKNLAHFLMKKL